jgi:hypothetical protein
MEFFGGLITGLVIGGTVGAVMVATVASGKIADIRRVYTPHRFPGPLSRRSPETVVEAPC